MGVCIHHSDKLGVVLKFGGTWSVVFSTYKVGVIRSLMIHNITMSSTMKGQGEDSSTQPFMPSTCRKWVGKKHAPLSPNLLTFVLFIRTFVLFINQYIYSCGMLLDLFQDRLLQYPLYIFFLKYTISAFSNQRCAMETMHGVHSRYISILGWTEYISWPGFI